MSDAMTNVGAALVQAQGKRAFRKRAQPKATAPAASTQGAPRTPADRFRRAANARPIVTFETAARMVPNSDQIASIVRHFALDDVDYDAIRDATEASVAAGAAVLRPALVAVTHSGEENAKGYEMHLQRIVGAFVGSAYGAASFYETKRQAARDLCSQFNDDRDEDRMGVDGLANRAQRAREFAAQLGLRAYATLAAAEGALSAFEHLTGSAWKPYEGAQDNGAAVAREAAAAQAAALGF